MEEGTTSLRSMTYIANLVSLRNKDDDVMKSFGRHGVIEIKLIAVETNCQTKNVSRPP